MFERLYSLEARALSWNSGKGPVEADGMEKRLDVHVLFHPSHLVRANGGQECVPRFPAAWRFWRVGTV